MIIPAFSKTYGQKKSAGFSGNGITAWKHICNSRSKRKRKIHIFKDSGRCPSGRPENPLGTKHWLSSPEALCLSYVCQKKHPAGRQGYPESGVLAKALSLTELEHKRADRLSGGETARMAMARLMMGTYDVVILDEPTAAMDMETTAAAETLIQSYVRQTNCILILVTHSLQQARRIADEAMFFQKGKY